MRSLQRRAVIGGLVWAVSAVFIGGFALVAVFDSIATRRFDALLKDRHLQVVAVVGNIQSLDAISSSLTDPAYSRPYSGRYWQVEETSEGIATSRSLFDTQLVYDPGGRDAFHLWTGQGPNGPVRGAHELITLEDGTQWTVMVAETLSTLIGERREVRRNVLISFGLVGIFMIVGAAALTSAVLRPIRKLREDVARRWDAGKSLEVEGYPAEVAPLVNDINELLKRNSEVVDTGRRQAADLAHALKTPSAALRNELESLHLAEAEVGVALQALDRIDAQIGRSLARLRSETASRTVNLKTDVGHSMARLVRLFRAMPASDATDFVAEIENDIFVPVDVQDLEEMLGNLLENAFKWRKARVRISSTTSKGNAVLCIEDDGPGIKKQQRDFVLSPGSRLDTAMPGTGLGLAISQDLAHAYGGSLDLGKSRDLGGLKAVIRLPLNSAGLSHLPGKDAGT